MEITDEKYECIVKKIDTLAEMVKEQQNIVIRNGGGNDVSYKREQFFQMIYDRLFKRWTWKNTILILKDATIIVGLIYTISQLIK